MEKLFVVRIEPGSITTMVDFVQYSEPKSAIRTLADPIASVVAVLFLPLFVFLPKLIQRGIKADTDTAIEAFGKNEQVKKVFWALFVAMAGLVLARVVDPVTAQQVVGIISGLGGG